MRLFCLQWVLRTEQGPQPFMIKGDERWQHVILQGSERLRRQTELALALVGQGCSGIDCALECLQHRTERFVDQAGDKSRFESGSNNRSSSKNPKGISW
jgi:hypothetical protein